MIILLAEPLCFNIGISKTNVLAFNLSTFFHTKIMNELTPTTMQWKPYLFFYFHCHQHRIHLQSHIRIVCSSKEKYKPNTTIEAKKKYFKSNIHRNWKWHSSYIDTQMFSSSFACRCPVLLYCRRFSYSQPFCHVTKWTCIYRWRRTMWKNVIIESDYRVIRSRLISAISNAKNFLFCYPHSQIIFLLRW